MNTDYEDAWRTLFLRMDDAKEILFNYKQRDAAGKLIDAIYFLCYRVQKLEERVEALEELLDRDLPGEDN